MMARSLRRASLNRAQLLLASFALATLPSVFVGGTVAESPDLTTLDPYVENAIEQWEVPGLGLAIVKDDEVVLAKGYGVTRIGGDEAVDGETVFAIGSASKAFTTAVLAMLIEDGKLDWDDRVTEHLRGFELFDPFVTRELTVRDLLTHRSGLPRGDLLWYGSDFDREEILHRVRLLEPSTSFRSRFGYQNILYLAAGQIIPTVSESSWDTLVRERLLFPLGMISSGTDLVDIRIARNVATPHARIDGKVQTVPWRSLRNIAPAGSINSNAVDMAQWLRLQLGKGLYGEERLLSEASIAEMHSPQTVIRKEGRWNLLFPQAQFLTYGLGWFLHDYYGHKVVEHGGNIDGMSAMVAMMPEKNLGVVILTNLNGNLLAPALMRRVFDLYRDDAPRDWSGEFLTAFRAMTAQGKTQKEKAEAARLRDTKPSLDLHAYTGTYTHPMFGEIVVREEDSGLVAEKGPAFIGNLRHWHRDTFESRWENRVLGDTLFQFELSASATIDSVEITGFDRFTRAPEKPEEVEEEDEEEEEEEEEDEEEPKEDDEETFDGSRGV